MNYIIKLSYMDGKDVNVSLPKEEITNFLEKLQKNEPYWAPNDENGFWTSNEQVRFTSIIKEKEHEIKKEEVVKEEPKKKSVIKKPKK